MISPFTRSRSRDLGTQSGRRSPSRDFALNDYKQFRENMAGIEDWRGAPKVQPTQQASSSSAVPAPGQQAPRY